jgi:AhpC/TSA family
LSGPHSAPGADGAEVRGGGWHATALDESRTVVPAIITAPGHRNEVVQGHILIREVVRSIAKTGHTLSAVGRAQATGRRPAVTPGHAAVYRLAFAGRMRYVGRPAGRRGHPWPPLTLCGDPAMTGLRFGQPAPDFTLPSTAGPDVTLSALRGQDVVLVFYCFDWGSI